MKNFTYIKWILLNISIISIATHFFPWFFTDTPQKDLPNALIILAITGPLICSTVFLVCKGGLSSNEAIAASMLPLALGAIAVVPIGYRLYVGMQNGNWMSMKELQPAYWVFLSSIAIFVLLAEYSFFAARLRRIQNEKSNCFDFYLC